MTILIVSVVVSLSISFLCSLMEAVLLSLTPSQVAQLSAKYPAVGVIWERFKANIERPIAVILILNTTAHTIGASVSGTKFSEIFGEEWIIIYSLGLTFVMLQFTEILPKTLGVYYNKRIALIIARPLAVAVTICAPIISLLHYLNRPFEGKRSKSNSPATLEEITALAGMARISKHIGPHEERIIKSATRLSQTMVRQVMIPIEQVSMISNTMTIEEAMVSAHIDAHTRFPVYENGDRSQVVGYVNFKEMIFFMSTNRSDPSLKGIIRPVHYVGAEVPTTDLLKTFIEQHEHIAIVREADGSCVGFVTFEDLVEELVGELQDEFDRLPRHIHQLSSGTWMFGGGVHMGDVASKVNQVIGESSAITLAAHIEQTLGRTPKTGDKVTLGGVAFTVRRTRRGKVFESTASAAT